LGYFSDRERHKFGWINDVINSFGKKVYPEDMERIAESIPSIREGQSAAFGAEDTASG